jgi:hypothetical protein
MFLGLQGLNIHVKIVILILERARTCEVNPTLRKKKIQLEILEIIIIFFKILNINFGK